MLQLYKKKKEFCIKYHSYIIKNVHDVKLKYYYKFIMEI